MTVHWISQANAYLDLGISVIPVIGKRAAVRWQSYQVRKMTLTELQQAFRSPDVTGVAGILGPVSSDLVCRDFDVPESYGSWKAHFPDLAKTLPTSETPHGFHVLFRAPGCRTRHALGDGDLQSKGAYIVLPNSVVNGDSYNWINGIGRIDKIPILNPEEAGLSYPWVHATQRTQEYSEDTITQRTNVVEELVIASQNEIVSINDAVAIAVPIRPRENHHHIFILARGLLNVQEHLGRELNQEERFLAFSGWYDRSKGFLRPGRNRDDYLFEFLEAVQLAKYPLGEGRSLQEAWNAALATKPPEICELSDPRKLLLASFCRELHKRTAPKPFFLTCRKVQELLELPDHTTAWRWLKGLTLLGILEIAERGNRHRASSFYYTGEDPMNNKGGG